MQRCTNCGAAARPGAKFCTSCGTRLNLDQAPASEWGRPASEETIVATPAAPPTSGATETAEQPTDAATDTDAAGSMVNEEPAEQAGEPQVTPVGATPNWQERTDQSPDAEPASDPAARASETDSGDGGERRWSWGQPVEASASEAPSTEPTEDVSDTTDAAGTAGGGASWTTRWPLMGSTDRVTADEAAGDSEPRRDEESALDRFATGLEEEKATDQASEPVSEPEAELATTTPAWPWERHGADDTEVVAEPETITAGESAPEAASADEGFTAVDTTAMVEPATGPSGESPRQRASALLDELRALLPQIAAGDAGPESGVVAGEVADRLTTARNEAGDFTSLRRTLESARQNPRDVDTMLDLVNRADRLVALLDSYERLTGEIDEAVARLRSG